MKEEKKLEGIILATIDYQENHKIIYLLTKDGKKNLLMPRAKSIKKGAIDTQNLTKAQFVASDKSLAKPKQFEAIDYYFEIKNDLNKMSVASYALELLYRYTDLVFDQERLYKMVEAFFQQLKGRIDLKLLLLEFRIKMLYFLGIQPNFKRCVHCGKADELMGLSLAFGGVECEKHLSNDNIGKTATQIIYHFYLDKDFSLTLADMDVVNYLSDIIDKYYEIHFHECLKSVKMLKEFNLY